MRGFTCLGGSPNQQVKQLKRLVGIAGNLPSSGKYKVVAVLDTKTCMEVEVELHSFSTRTLGAGEW